MQQYWRQILKLIWALENVSLYNNNLSYIGVEHQEHLPHPGCAASRLMNWSAWSALKRVCTFRVSGNPHQWGPQVDSALHCAGQRAQQRLSFLRFLCSTCGRASVSATCARDDSIWINGISILCILSLEMITICKWGHFFFISDLCFINWLMVPVNKDKENTCADLISVLIPLHYTSWFMIERCKCVLYSCTKDKFY